MALTKEQFQGLKSKGLSTEQIIRFESKSKPVQNQPGLVESTMTNLSRPGAAIRERVKTLGMTGNLETANNAADLAWQNPQNSELNQEKYLKEYYSGKESPSALKQIGGLGVSAAGLAQDFVEDPVQLALAGLTEGLVKGIAPIKYKGLSIGDRASKLPVSKLLASEKGQMVKAAKESGKAVSKTEQLLKASDPKFIQAIERGETYNPAEQASKYIQPAKDYTEVTDQLRLAKGFPMEERAAAYQKGILSENRSQLDPVQSLLNEKVKSPQGARDAKLISDIQTKEVDFLNQQSPEILSSPEFYQSQKSYYQNLADQASAYGADPSQSSKAEAYKALAQGYQNKTYAVDEAIKSLNLENAGLGEAAGRTAELAAVERGATPKGVAAEVIEDIRPSKEGIFAALTRTLGRKILGPKVERLTKGISKSASKASEAEKMAELIKQATKLEQVALSYPKQLPAPKQGQIGINKRSMVSRMLPQGQESGPVIEVPGSTTLEMPELTESQLRQLATKYGVPDRNVRSSQVMPEVSGSSPIVEGGRPASLTKAQEKSLKEMMLRRSRNFK